MSKLFTARRALAVAAFLLICFILLHTPSSRTNNGASPKPAPHTGKSGLDLQSLEKSPSSPVPKDHSNQKVVQDISSMPLRERLAYQFPYDLESKFPAYIWQTWKVGPASGQFEERLRPLEASWSEKHPGFVHEVISDDSAIHLISYLYAAVPEVVEAYSSMPAPVVKADFFRYLILLARGGVYTDIDTRALKSTIDWLPENIDRSTVGLVVGIEADPDREDWASWYARRIQFCQWTMQAKAGHPVLLDIVATITEDTLSMKKRGVLQKHNFEGKNPAEKSIMEYTGPGVWTDAIFSYFNDHKYFDFSQREGNISYSDFFGLTKHKQTGDVVVLPITSFSPGVQQMGAQDVDDPMAFVKHEFDGSWKPSDEKIKT